MWPNHGRRMTNAGLCSINTMSGDKTRSKDTHRGVKGT